VSVDGRLSTGWLKLHPVLKLMSVGGRLLTDWLKKSPVVNHELEDNQITNPEMMFIQFKEREETNPYDIVIVVHICLVEEYNLFCEYSYMTITIIIARKR
jgi:hypothetical protein